MNARMFHVQLGQGKLGWVGKLVVGLIALVVIALLVMFSLFAAVIGGVALLVLKVVRALSPASASPSPAPEIPSWLRREDMGDREHLEAGSLVRDVEVEVLPADPGPKARS